MRKPRETREKYNNHRPEDGNRTAEAIDRALEKSRRYITAIIAVAAAANEIVENSTKDSRNRYYYRVTTKRFNVLRGAVEVLSEIAV